MAQWQEFRIKEFAFLVISGSSHMVANIIIIGDLHGC